MTRPAPYSRPVSPRISVTTAGRPWPSAVASAPDADSPLRYGKTVRGASRISVSTSDAEGEPTPPPPGPGGGGAARPPGAPAGDPEVAGELLDRLDRVQRVAGDDQAGVGDLRER